MIEISVEVSEAVAAGEPVIALESSIIAHGLPAPDNLEVAEALERAARQAGAIPATVAVIDGVARVGLQRSELERLADPQAGAAKAGAADLAVIIAAGGLAATTVSATSVLARRAGIEVFATGGIGGVHRGDTGDESSDLAVLARTPIAVVASGPKCILDLPRTAERLESLAVPVLGYRTDCLPAFYSRSSPVGLEHRVDSVDELAAVLAVRFSGLGQGGVLVANPIPEADEIPAAELEPLVEAAEREAAAARVTGKALTPFLLQRLQSATAGRAVAANRALALANTELAAHLAVALASRR